MLAKTSVEPNTLHSAIVNIQQFAHHLGQTSMTHSPPRSVGLVVLELSREEHSDQNLKDASLHHNDSDHSKYGVRRVPQLEEPLREATGR